MATASLMCPALLVHAPSVAQLRRATEAVMRDLHGDGHRLRNETASIALPSTDGTRQPPVAVAFSRSSYAIVLDAGGSEAAAVMDFVRTVASAPHVLAQRRTLVLHDVDRLPHALQQALHNLIEKNAGVTLFVMTTTRLHATTAPLQSRSVVTPAHALLPVPSATAATAEAVEAVEAVEAASEAFEALALSARTSAATERVARAALDGAAAARPAAVGRAVRRGVALLLKAAAPRPCCLAVLGAARGVLCGRADTATAADHTAVTAAEVVELVAAADHICAACQDVAVTVAALEHLVAAVNCVLSSRPAPAGRPGLSSPAARIRASAWPPPRAAPLPE
jgi:hypothetical protein